MTSTPPMTSSISVIIPALNEETNIAELAANLAGCGCEIVLVDGGSSDATVARAKAFNMKVILGGPGKARQLNLGARAAGGDIFLFLHADTRLPKDFDSHVRQALSDPDCSAGAFRLALKNPTPAMRFIAACANLRASLLQLPYGDQALFVRKETFFGLNMFPDLPIMEDYVFVRKARKSGKITMVKEYAVTSARRWRRLGIVRTTIINQLIVMGYYLKIPPQRLALLYRRR